MTPRSLASAAFTAAPAPSAIASAFIAALAAGQAFAGATSPNPPVGCVILDEAGAVLATGAHVRAGLAHAEVVAIQACRRLGLADRIHTIVVTLEPCNHHGATPPCTEAILATSARAVWIGARDPNPVVAGGGAARLAEQGLTVALIEVLPHPQAQAMSHAAQRLIGPFRTRLHSGRPWLTLKQALTAEGAMTPPPGRKTFTSDASLDFAHGLRRRCDALITGSGCILADNPEFTVRRVPDHPNMRRRLAILDRRRRTPRDYIAAAEARGFVVDLYSDIPQMLSVLAKAGVLEALVECGPTLLAAFHDADLWDEQVLIQQSPVADEPDRITVVARPPDRLPA